MMIMLDHSSEAVFAFSHWTDLARCVLVSCINASISSMRATPLRIDIHNGTSSFAVLIIKNLERGTVVSTDSYVNSVLRDTPECPPVTDRPNSFGISLRNPDIKSQN